MIVNTLLSQALTYPPYSPPPLLHTYQRFSISLGVNLKISIPTSWANMVASSLLFSLNSPHAPHSFTLHSHCPYQFLRDACSPCHRPSTDCVLGKLTNSSFSSLAPLILPPPSPRETHNGLVSIQTCMYL